MRRSILFILLSLFVVSCGPQYVDFFPCHSDGVPKPRISFVPVFDRTGCVLSKEFTDIVTYEFRSNGNLYLLYQDEVEEDMARAGNANCFGADVNFARAFRDTDYILLLELLEHRPVHCREVNQILPAVNRNPCGMLNNVLVMKMRVRIIDVSCDPVVIHQEILSHEFVMPWQCNDPKLFPSAHKIFAEQIARRVEKILCIRW